jgi:hypothetical protein
MWLYNDKEIDEPPNNAVGFIYVITNELTMRKYVGRKLLTKAAYKTTNGVKKKIRKESDWHNYFGSCKELLSDIETFGSENFKREIVMFCASKAAMTYAEEKLQYQLEVLENHMWYNSNIRSRIFKKTIMGKVANTTHIIEKYKEI